jgi:hypothetical protein
MLKPTKNLKRMIFKVWKWRKDRGELLKAPKMAGNRLKAKLRVRDVVRVLPILTWLAYLR